MDIGKLEHLQAENDMLKQQLSDLLRNQTQSSMVNQASLERISFLEAMLETMPIGVIVAEAPSGRITMGNSYAEKLLGQPIYTSANADSYGEWNSFYADGSRVQSHEYPLAKVIRENADYAELDVQYQRADGTRVWIRIIGRPVLADDGTVRGATIALVDIDNERHLMDQQDVMIAELNHRVKNAFTVVKSIVSQSLRGTNTPPAARETIDDRLDAYAKAHSQLIGNRWDRAEIGRIVEDTIGRIAGGRIEVSGSQIEVPSRIAMALSMAIYELGTNAVKHGSLSVPQGRVLMDWAYVSPDNDAVKITWTELGGPEPVVPKTKGFGSKIIDQILAAETEGKVVIDYPKSGFTWCLELPLSQED